MKEKILVITGPTAAGKSAVGVEAARLLDGEVISCDSMQIYRHMRIGTAVPSDEERGGVVHHMLEIVEPDETYSVARYQEDALAVIEGVISRGKLPVVVGGTGLYVNSLTYKLDFAHSGANEELRARLSEEYDADADAVYARLAQLDPPSTARIHRNDKKRIVRRLEIILDGRAGEYDFMRENDDFDFCIAGITKERPALYAGIEARVDDMLSRGLAQEALQIYNDFGADITAFSAIGYKEFIPYFNGISSLGDVVSDIKKNTRHFAKRQLTWFSRDSRLSWFDIGEYGGAKKTAEAVARYYKAKGQNAT